jgi:Fe-S cluster biogenesis protein NfuA
MARAQRTGALEAASSSPVNQTPFEAQARRLIDDILRPLIAADGGVIELVSATEARLVVKLTGTCAGCPGRPYTLSGVIERAARKYLSPTIQVDLSED